MEPRQKWKLQRKRFDKFDSIKFLKIKFLEDNGQHKQR